MSHEVHVGQVEEVYTQAGRLSGYRLELRHLGLHEYRLLKAPNHYVLKNKADTQLAAWHDKWQRITSKAAVQQSKSQSKETADLISQQAQKAFEEARNLLAAAVGKRHAVRWKAMEDRKPFVFSHDGRFPNVRFNDTDGSPGRPIYSAPPDEPLLAQFRVAPTFFDKIIPGRKNKRDADTRTRFTAAHDLWEINKSQNDKLNKGFDLEFEDAKRTYRIEKETFEREQRAANDQISDLKARYETKQTSAVVTVVELILNQSEYPDWHIKDYLVAYSADTGTLIIDYTLPKPESLPSISKAAYVASRNEIKTTYLSEAEQGRLFDSILYQIALRTIYEIFSGDTAETIEAIVFNGWLTWTNKGTGLEETGCLLSLQTTRAETENVDFSKVDPKTCFRELKGVSAAKLSGITPVAPIVKINMDDPRFVASHDVAVDESINLASIDWEEFEHLVREIFGREFSKDGGDVKITRASADGGVDAVAFDPDPIRGGKIVIQAKRYTATVGVSAVRDLYGTMMNEGAMKGILVTTSDYGPDSYTFAKDKPITLLNGGNLLQLLEKHGHKARIDLAEARRERAMG